MKSLLTVAKQKYVLMSWKRLLVLQFTLAAYSIVFNSCLKGMLWKCLKKVLSRTIKLKCQGFYQEL